MRNFKNVAASLFSLVSVNWLSLVPIARAGDQASAAPADEHHHHDHMAGDESGAEHDHDASGAKSDYERTLGAYAAPKVTLVDQFQRPVRLDQLLEEDRPLLVQFIFTSCTTICPVMGAVFGGAQDDVAALAPNYRMVSISIDPEYDTPERLLEFAQKQNARGDWELLTGSAADIQSVIKAFDVLYQGDNKMYHQPYTFMRWSSKNKWVRIRGLMSVADLTREFAESRRDKVK